MPPATTISDTQALNNFSNPSSLYRLSRYDQRPLFRLEVLFLVVFEGNENSLNDN